MPTVTVTAQKQEEDKQKVPVSVTAVPRETIEHAGIHIVSEAAIYAPNTFFTEWSARKLSNARFRGISLQPEQPWDHHLHRWRPPGPRTNSICSTSSSSMLEEFAFICTVTFNNRLDLIAGARLDYEDKTARLETFYDPPLASGTAVEGDRSFSNVSPQVALAYRLLPQKTLYVTVGRGYKAGGFNAASPPGSEAYGEEHAWHFEGGAKTLWANGRLSTNVALFYIGWDELQLNVPNPAVPAQFCIANVGGAVSKGVELEVNAKPAPSLDLFSAVGYTHARFSEGSVSGGVSVEGNELPNTPALTASAGLQYSRAVGPATLHGRADVVFYGDFQYNDANTLGQDAYSLVNLRLGVTGGS